MANQVYANNREVACKEASGKSICAFPDVCFTPPQTPATPPGVPIPYPNTGMAKDTTKGSKKTKISGKEIMLKNQSHFKTSYGDEAGCAPKKGILTSKNKGKIYFTAWSMDVKVEGKNAVRHLDLTTHNHSSFPGNTPVWPYLDTMSMSDPGHKCVENQIAEMQACSDCKPYGEGDPCANEKCTAARKCMLAPYDPKKGEHPNVYQCCEGTTGHHVIPQAEFCKAGKPRGRPLASVPKYRENLAPCVCVEGEDHKEYKDVAPYQLKEHGLCGRAYLTERKKKGIKNNQKNIKYTDLKDCGSESVCKIFKQCDKECIEAQLDNYHNKAAEVPADEPVLRASQQSHYSEFDKSRAASAEEEMRT